MNKPDVQKIVNDIRNGISKNSPAILTGLGIAGMATTVVLAVTATPKVLGILDEAEEEKGEPLTKGEVVKAAWKPYVPAAVMFVASSACFIGSHKISTSRTTAIATAYQLSQSAFATYREKVMETIGEKKESVVRDKVADEHLKQNPVSKSEVIITKAGDTLCYDAFSGRYFKSDIETLRRAENKLNKCMISENYISLNEFYNEIGLEGVKQGDDMGWNVADCFIELNFTTRLAEDGTPCIVMDYLVGPRWDFMSLH